MEKFLGRPLQPERPILETRERLQPGRPVPLALVTSLLSLGLVLTSSHCHPRTSGVPERVAVPDASIFPEASVAPDASVVPDASVTLDAGGSPDASVSAEAITAQRVLDLAGAKLQRTAAQTKVTDCPESLTPDGTRKTVPNTALFA